MKAVPGHPAVIGQRNHSGGFSLAQSLTKLKVHSVIRPELPDPFHLENKDHKGIKSFSPGCHQFLHVLDTPLGGRIGEHGDPPFFQGDPLYFQIGPPFPFLQIEIQPGPAISPFSLNGHPFGSKAGKPDGSLPQPLFHNDVGGHGIHVDQKPSGRQPLPFFPRPGILLDDPDDGKRQLPGAHPLAMILQVQGGPFHQQFFAAPRIFYMTGGRFPFHQHFCHKPVPPFQEDSFYDIFVFHRLLLSICLARYDQYFSTICTRIMVYYCCNIF